MKNNLEIHNRRWGKYDQFIQLNEGKVYSWFTWILRILI